MREILFRGKMLDDGEWVEGNLLQWPDGEHYICIPQKAIWALYMEKFQVDPATVGQYTGMSCENGMLFEGDVVEFFGMRGEIVQECGAFGIAVSKGIDYDLLESKIPHNNSANFCYNDNFISLWELFWNYEQDDNPLFEVRKIGNRWDNPELLEEVGGDA